MKTDKLIYLALILACKTSMASNIKNPAMQYNATDKALKTEDVLSNIFENDLDLSTIAQVSRCWNKTSKSILKLRYRQLMDLGNPRILQLLQLPKGAMPRYKNFIDLYKKLAKQAGMPRAKPNIDITNTQLLLNMIQTSRDHNLVLIWPEINRALNDLGVTPTTINPTGQSTLNTVRNTQEVTTLNQIREWLNNQTNQVIIQQITELDLGNLDLTYLPRELSLFNGLQVLWLNCNQLTAIDIPDTLVNLEELFLSNNQLEIINIPATIRDKANIYGEENQSSVTDDLGLKDNLGLGCTIS